MAGAENPFWAGDASLDSIANQIARACGPSGLNREYLFRLADAMRAITTVDDEHLYTLEQLVKNILVRDE
jgi:glutathione-specific gamma-glutamylcyclotransferase